MKVRDLIKDCVSELWITAEEDPHRQEPDLKIHCCSDADEAEYLSDKVLDSEIYLIMATDRAIYISLNW